MFKQKMPLALIHQALAAIVLVANGAGQALDRTVADFSKSASAIDKLRGLGLDAESVCGNAFASRVAREVTTYSQMAKALDLKAD